MNLFSELLSTTQSSRVTATGPRIQKRRGVEIKSAWEVKIMRRASSIVATVLREVMDMVEPGQTTRSRRFRRTSHPRDGSHTELQGISRFPGKYLRQHQQRGGAWHPQPQAGDPQGDLLKVDTGAYYEGYHGDSCVTICVGEASPEAQTLSRVARESLMAGLAQIKAGNTLLDIAGAVEDHVLANGFSVVEDYTVHGVGRNLHEEPSVFNFRTGRTSQPHPSAWHDPRGRADPQRRQ